MISVMLVDDHAIIREGLKAILANDHIAICGEAESLDEMTEILHTCHPDVILLDLSLKNDDEGGFKALELITEYYPDIAVIILSVYAQASIVRKALALGAKGYVAKGEAATHILKAVHEVAAGEIYLTAATIKDLILYDQSNPKQLSSRELEILKLLGSWYSTKEIASLLHISNSTVGTHIENLKEKLHITSKQELIQYAIDRKKE